MSAPIQKQAGRLSLFQHASQLLLKLAHNNAAPRRARQFEFELKSLFASGRGFALQEDLSSRGFEN